jgi:hypothetical protein
MKPMSPKKIDAQLRIIIEHLGLDERLATHLKYARPTSFEPEVNNCHFNAWCQWKEMGGEIQHGWIFGQDKAVAFAEAIFHTVWKSPEGRLIDITPRSDNEKRVLFIPDGMRCIELSGHQGMPAINTYDNVRLFGSNIVTPLERIKVVMQSDFVHRHKIYPW